MESLIQVRLQSFPNPKWLNKGSSVSVQPVIPLTISPVIQRRELRNKELHAKRRGSDAAVSVSTTKNNPKEQNPIGKDDDEIPKPVLDRMLRRIAIAVALPMGTGVSLIYVLSKLSREQGVEIPGFLPFIILLISFGTGSLCMAYGTLSTSWDPEKEGSFLGFEQIEKNWPVLWAEEIEKESRP